MNALKSQTLVAVTRKIGIALSFAMGLSFIATGCSSGTGTPVQSPGTANGSPSLSTGNTTPGSPPSIVAPSSLTTRPAIEFPRVEVPVTSSFSSDPEREAWTLVDYQCEGQGVPNENARSLVAALSENGNRITLQFNANRIILNGVQVYENPPSENPIRDLRDIYTVEIRKSISLEDHATDANGSFAFSSSAATESYSFEHIYRHWAETRETTSHSGDPFNTEIEQLGNSIRSALGMWQVQTLSYSVQESIAEELCQPRAMNHTSHWVETQELSISIPASYLCHPQGESRATSEGRAVFRRKTVVSSPNS